MSASLQQRISLGVVANTAAVVLIAAIAIWFANRSWLMQGLDRDLQGRAERMRRFDALPASEWRPRPLLMPENSSEADGRIDLRRSVLVLDAASGEVLQRAPQLPAYISRIVSSTDRGLQSLHLGPELRLRVLAVRLQRGLPTDLATIRTATTRPVIVFLASDLAPIEDELARMAALLSALWITASLLAWGTVRWSGRTLLRPVHDLSAALDRLGPDDFSGRVAVDVGPLEFRGMVDRLNLLLARLEQAFRREQTTIGVIAHELRTPVATLRTTIEFRQLVATDSAERTVLATCARTIERMQALVTNLLLLARLEAGKETLHRETVDLVTTLRDVLPADPRVSTTLPSQALVRASPVHVRLVLDNLLSNAVAHALPVGPIRIGIEGSTMTFTNPCAEGIDTTQLGTVFYRADAARSDGDHCGLGLALVSRLVRLLDGTLIVTAAAGEFRVVVTLPPA